MIKLDLKTSFDENKRYLISGKCLNVLFDTIKIPRENTEAEICFKIGYFSSVLENEDFEPAMRTD